MEGPVTKEIISRLTASFSPSKLGVDNLSEQHRGHAGYTDGESHFHVTIEAAAFEGHSRVAQQRMVMKELQDLMPKPIHALGITVR